MRGTLSTSLVLVVFCSCCGCQKEPESLQLSDLSPAEYRFIERFVTLERARAVAMVDAEQGNALLDSLAATWGDSSLAQTRRDLPSGPRRISALHDLLGRILAAENDSLLHAPVPRRLAAPLPDPAPANPAES